MPLRLRERYPRSFDATAALIAGLIILLVMEISTDLVYRNFGISVEARIINKYSKNYLTGKKEEVFKSSLYEKSFIHYTFIDDDGKEVEAKDMVRDEELWKRSIPGEKIYIEYLKLGDFSRLVLIKYN